MISKQPQQRRKANEARERELIFMRVITAHKPAHISMCVCLPTLTMASILKQFVKIPAYNHLLFRKNAQTTTKNRAPQRTHIYTYILVHICLYIHIICVCALQLFTLGFILQLFVVIIVTRHLYWVNEACAKLINKPDNANNHLLQLQQKPE